MTTKREYKIIIKAKFGSEFQEKVAVKALGVMLRGWLEFYNNSHKENDITFRLKENYRLKDLLK